MYYKYIYIKKKLPTSNFKLTAYFIVLTYSVKNTFYKKLMIDFYRPLT